jgi:hypothetical protein
MSSDSERIERQRAANTKKIDAAMQEAAREHRVASLVDVAGEVLKNRSPKRIHLLPAVDAAALWMLYAALTGTNNGKLVNGTDRKTLFDAAMATLSPAIEAYAQDEAQREWVADYLTPKLAELKSDLEFAQADDRVRGAIVLPGNHVVDPNDDRHPREQAEALHEAIPKLVETISHVNEMVIKLNEEAIKKQVERLLAGHDAHGVKAGSLVELGNVLSTVNGYLVLTDDELREKLHDVDGLRSGIRTIGELVKGVVELTGGVLGIVSSTVGIVARAAGEPEIARVCSAVSRKVGLGVGAAVGAIEALRGIATLFDSRATRDEKVDAGVTIATVGAPSVLGWFKVEALGPVAVTPAAIAGQLGYGELKLALQTYWAASQGLVAGLMGPAFETLRQDGTAIAAFADEVVKAQALLATEQDQAQKDALARVLASSVRNLSSMIDSLLADLARPDLEAGMARHPGAYQILRDALAPVRPFRGAQATETVLLGASVALRCLEYVFSHQAAIIDAAASHRGFSDVVEHASQTAEQSE